MKTINFTTDDLDTVAWMHVHRVKPALVDHDGQPCLSFDLNWFAVTRLVEFYADKLDRATPATFAQTVDELERLCIAAGELVA